MCVYVCARVSVCLCAAEMMCEQYYSDRSQGAEGRNPPYIYTQRHTRTHGHARTRTRTHTHTHTHTHTLVSLLMIYHYLPQRRGEQRGTL